MQSLQGREAACNSLNLFQIKFVSDSPVCIWDKRHKQHGFPVFSHMVRGVGWEEEH